MPVTEESRHRLHQALDTAIGPEEATTLMEYLPPLGWSDVATKADLDHLRTATRQDIDRLDQRFDGVNDQFKLVNDQFKVVNDQFKVVNDQFKAVYGHFDIVHAGLAQIGKDVTTLVARIDASDRRSEALTTRVDQLIWQVIGLLGVIGVILIGYAQIVG